ncbi:hypothetical protein EVAR_77117_1 [Eumeta japonica]|uniref:Uncharacterized protein n=1 Tax=Eumeta variegata TaxID=151549 RepID=A0A4C1T1W3_EUMVA|nr:hypothetical protein EVAR_77117_1 [Eumeta japonica]
MGLYEDTSGHPPASVGVNLHLASFFIIRMCPWFRPCRRRMNSLMSVDFPVYFDRDHGLVSSSIQDPLPGPVLVPLSVLIQVSMPIRDLSWALMAVYRTKVLLGEPQQRKKEKVIKRCREPRRPAAPGDLINLKRYFPRIGRSPGTFEEMCLLPVIIADLRVTPESWGFVVTALSIREENNG